MEEKQMNDYGHRKMVVWKNIDELEKMVYMIIKSLPKNKFNLLNQIERACDSVGANFIEGYYSGSIKEYIRFLKYSKRSLAELQGWIGRTYNREYIKRGTFQEFDSLAIRTMYLLNRLINALILKSNNTPARP